MEMCVKRLKEWAIEFLKNRDLIFRKIIGLAEEPGTPCFTVTYKDRTQQMICAAYLDPSVLELLRSDLPIGLFVFHTQKSYMFLMENWGRFSSLPLLTVYFVNPFHSIDNKWILQPHNHAKIADSASFKTGMDSMFSMVEQVREEDLKTGKDF